MDAPPPDDEADRLCQVVQARFGSRVRDFRVVARAGGIALQGRVGSYHVKQLVQEVVVGATASRVVANELAVSDSIPPGRPVT